MTFKNKPDSATDNLKASEKQVAGNHYKKYKIQPGYFCEVNGLDGYESAVVKYVVRHQDKGGREDIDKAIHCLELIKEIKYPIQEELEFEEMRQELLKEIRNIRRK